MEVASRNLRALKLWHGLCPCLLPSILLSSAFTALSPYVTIWLSARLVDELAGLRRPQTLLTLALAELLSAALLALAAGALKRWKNAEMDASLSHAVYGTSGYKKYTLLFSSCTGYLSCNSGEIIPF